MCLKIMGRSPIGWLIIICLFEWQFERAQHTSTITRRGRQTLSRLSANLFYYCSRPSFPSFPFFLFFFVLLCFFCFVSSFSSCSSVFSFFFCFLLRFFFFFLLFPTCQVRVVRFYVSWPAACASASASASASAGHQLQALDRSGPRRT